MGSNGSTPVPTDRHGFQPTAVDDLDIVRIHNDDIVAAELHKVDTDDLDIVRIRNDDIIAAELHTDDKETHGTDLGARPSRPDPFDDLGDLEINNTDTDDLERLAVDLDIVRIHNDDIIAAELHKVDLGDVKPHNADASDLEPRSAHIDDKASHRSDSSANEGRTSDLIAEDPTLAQQLPMPHTSYPNPPTRCERSADRCHLSSSVASCSLASTNIRRARTQWQSRVCLSPNRRHRVPQRIHSPS